MDLNIEENTLKHISEGMEYYLYTFLKLTTLESLILGRVNYKFILAVKIPFKIQRGIFYEGRDDKSE